MLKVIDLEVGYGSLKVLHGIRFEVPTGSIVALLGGNGAGKTTTMKAIAGLIPPQGGTIVLDGARIERAAAHQIFKLGLALVPQGRELFPSMTVAENIELGALQSNAIVSVGPAMREVLAFLPALAGRLGQKAGTLSGGEQQMLAAARALIAKPKLLLLDEPSAGLAPLIVLEFARVLERLKSAGQTILIVEQNVRLALRVADYAYFLRDGRIVAEGDAGSFRDDDTIFRSYIG